jgi:hypothetical protein
MANNFAGGCAGHTGDDVTGSILFDQLVREVISPDGVSFSVDFAKKPGNSGCVFDTEKIYLDFLSCRV